MKLPTANSAPAICRNYQSERIVPPSTPNLFHTWHLYYMILQFIIKWHLKFDVNCSAQLKNVLMLYIIRSACKLSSETGNHECLALSFM